MPKRPQKLWGVTADRKRSGWLVSGGERRGAQALGGVHVARGQAERNGFRGRAGRSRRPGIYRERDERENGGRRHGRRRNREEALRRLYDLTARAGEAARGGCYEGG